MLPPSSFSNPQVLVCKQGLQGIHQLLPLYPARLPSSPQSSFSAAPEHPWAPPAPWKVRALSEFHHTQMQSPYLGLGADTSPLPGREPGQGRPEGPCGLCRGAGALPCPTFGMHTHVPRVRAAGPGDTDPRWHPATCPQPGPAQLSSSWRQSQSQLNPVRPHSAQYVAAGGAQLEPPHTQTSRHLQPSPVMCFVNSFSLDEERATGKR